MERSEIMKTAKPIYLGVSEIVNIMQRRKTQFIKLLQNQDEYSFAWDYEDYVKQQATSIDVICESGYRYALSNKIPYYIGEYLYVKEPWVKTDIGYLYKAGNITYRDGGIVQTNWNSARKMPKDAVRNILRITNMDVMRIQDISYLTCVNDGFVPPDYQDSGYCMYCKLYPKTQGDPLYCREYGMYNYSYCPDAMMKWGAKYKREYGEYWDKRGKWSAEERKKFSWQANPYVIVYEFAKVLI